MSILESSAQRGARLVALHALDQAAAAAERLRDPDDAEALHDLRVALRRLRSYLRAYESVLDDAVPRRQRRRLARLAQRTGPGRDAEVQLALLDALATELDPLDGPGLEWARAAIAAERDEAYAALRERVLRRFGKLEPRVRERLAVYQVTVHLGEPAPRPRFLDLVAGALPDASDALRAAMEAVGEHDAPEAAHCARLAGKRVRYLIEPLRDELPEVKERVRELRRLQDALGELNDLHTLAARIGRAIEDAALDGARRLREAALGAEPVDVEHVMRTDARRGLLALLQRVRARSSGTLARVRQEWLVDGELGRLLAGLDELGRRLVRAPGVEIERKYLLTALPPRCEGQPYVEIDQGYLPGEKLIERIRRKRTPEGETYVRTVKLGQGMVRIEVEEPCSREVFEPLWALTERRRVEKVRYAIEEGALVWEIDAFRDRELYLAEIELPSEDVEVVLPDWLAPYVEREVTSEATYVNANLAR